MAYRTMFLVALLPIKVLGQSDPWEGDGQYRPSIRLGLSSAACDSKSGHLFFACEKWNAVLRFDRDGENATVIRVPIKEAKVLGSQQPASPHEFDIEAIAIHEGRVYLADEDNLRLFSFMIPELGESVEACVEIAMPTIGDGKEDIDNSPIPRKKQEKRYADRKSIEGLVVTDQYLGSDRPAPQPLWFYLLDEQDEVSEPDGLVARIYIAYMSGNVLRHHKTVTFRLQESERLTEPLLARQDALCDLIHVQETTEST